MSGRWASFTTARPGLIMKKFIPDQSEARAYGHGGEIPVSTISGAQSSSQPRRTSGMLSSLILSGLTSARRGPSKVMCRVYVRPIVDANDGVDAVLVAQRPLQPLVPEHVAAA